jgi:hypothetical protein
LLEKFFFTCNLVLASPCTQKPQIQYGTNVLLAAELELKHSANEYFNVFQTPTVPSALAPCTARLAASKKYLVAAAAANSVRATLSTTPAAATVSGGVCAVKPAEKYTAFTNRGF